VSVQGYNSAADLARLSQALEQVFAHA
jgi:hypothetical protein